MAKLLTDAEVWRPVLGYEGLYEVSNYGRVRTLIQRAGNYFKLKKYVRFTPKHIPGKKLLRVLELSGLLSLVCSMVRRGGMQDEHYS